MCTLTPEFRRSHTIWLLDEHYRRKEWIPSFEMKNVAGDYTIKLMLRVNTLPIRAITRHASQYFSISALFLTRVGGFLRISGWAGAAGAAAGRAPGAGGKAGRAVPGPRPRTGGTRQPPPGPGPRPRRPRRSPAAEAAALLALTARAGAEGRPCPAPTPARALLEKADPKPEPFACQRAPNGPGRSRPSLTWLGRFRRRLGHGCSRPKRGRGSGATAMGCPGAARGAERRPCEGRRSPGSGGGGRTGSKGGARGGHRPRPGTGTAPGTARRPISARRGTRPRPFPSALPGPRGPPRRRGRGRARGLG